MSKKIKLPQNYSGSWTFDYEKINAWAYYNNLFSPEECKKIIDYANQFEKEIGAVGHQEKTNVKIRQSQLVWFSPNDENKWIYEKLTGAITKLNDDYFNFDLFGFSEPLQFTEYTAPNGHYGKHTDCAYNTRIRKLSIVIQLSDPKDYKGGELQIHITDNPFVMEKGQGTLICFPSYSLHEVTPITKGTRYTLVGWITGKPFK